jgi:hypothetical protein
MNREKLTADIEDLLRLYPALPAENGLPLPTELEFLSTADLEVYLSRLRSANAARYVKPTGQTFEL